MPCEQSMSLCPSVPFRMVTLPVYFGRDLSWVYVETSNVTRVVLDFSSSVVLLCRLFFFSTSLFYLIPDTNVHIYS